MIGYSAGGSAVLELKSNYPDRKITPITYNTPVFERSNYDSWMDEDKKPLRFTSSWDPVSMLHYNSRVTYKAPDVNLDVARNAAKTYTNPKFENVNNAVKSGFPDPLMGQHSMKGTYSNPSSAKDFIESGANMVVAGNTLGSVAL